VGGGELAYGPQMLPDGEHLLFTLSTGTGGVERWDKGRIVVQSLKSGERKTVIDGGADGRYVPTGYIVYAFGGVVFAVPFDVKRLQQTGGAVPVVEGVRRGGVTAAAQFSTSATGSLVFIPGPISTSAGLLEVALIDRKGTAEALKLQAGSYDHLRVSPDGKRIAF